MWRHHATFLLTYMLLMWCNVQLHEWSGQHKSSLLMLSAAVAGQPHANCLRMLSVACSSQRMVAKGVLCGLSIPATTFKVGDPATYMYLSLLSPAEAVQALQQSLEATQVYSSGRLQSLLKSSQLRTQLAVAFGLPILVESLQQALLDDEVCIGLNSKIDGQQRYAILI